LGREKSPSIKGESSSSKMKGGVFVMGNNLESLSGERMRLRGVFQGKDRLIQNKEKRLVEGEGRRADVGPKKGRRRGSNGGE